MADYLIAGENKIDIEENKQIVYLLGKILNYKVPVKRTKHEEQIL